jgi:hypothetical protein
MTSAKYISGEKISCKSPSATFKAGDLVSISVTYNGVQFSPPVGERFTIVADTVLTSIEPSFGGKDGGYKKIVLHGFNFLDSNDLLCRFGASFTTQATYISSTSVSCFVPSSEHVKKTTVELSMNGGSDWSQISSNIVYEYVASPTITSVTPSNGPSTGGSKIVVMGSGFLDRGKLLLRFSSIDDEIIVDAPCTYVSSMSASCVTPAFPVDALVALSFSINSGAVFTSAESGDSLSFKFHKQMEVTAVTPKSAPITKNTLLTVVGSGFFRSPTLFCVFESASGVKTFAHGNFLATSAIQCVTPSSIDKIGEYKLTVSANLVDYATSVDVSFIFFDGSFSSLSISPTSGTIFGSTPVTVSTVG